MLGETDTETEIGIQPGFVNDEALVAALCTK